jgi:hypothetical protein
VEDRDLAQDALTRVGRELAAIRMLQGYESQYQYGLTLGIGTSSAARVENGENHRLGPIIRYADGLGYDVEIRLVPRT